MPEEKNIIVRVPLNPPKNSDPYYSYKPQIFGNVTGDDGDFSRSHTGQLINSATREFILSTYPPIIAQDVKTQEALYSEKLKNLISVLTENIHSLAEGKENPNSTIKQIQNYIKAVDELIAQKTNEYTAQKVIADKYYYGQDFFSRPTSQFIRDATGGIKTNYPPQQNYA